MEEALGARCGLGHPIFRVIACVLLLSLVLIIVGCGPIYETRYNFVPPTEPHSAVCLTHCYTGKIQCQQLEQVQLDNCENRAERERYRCEWQIRRDKKREPKWYECGGSHCSVDEERCEANYRSCYQACGGQVNSEQVCVANCKQ